VRRFVFPALLLVAGCSNLPTDASGVISLEVIRPEPATVEVGDTIQLSARALDAQGDSVAVPITWQTSDTTIWVDSTTGRVTGLVPGKTGRVQASETSLVSNPITLTVIGRPDTLVVAPDTLIVPAGTSASTALVASLLSRDDTAASGFIGAVGARMIIAITSPTFTDPATRTVQLSNNALADTVAAGADGLPTTAVTVNRVDGATAPDTVRVTISGVHRSGAPVAGSGQEVLVVFQ